MAKNLDVQIDTASFLESIRPEMPPARLPWGKDGHNSGIGRRYTEDEVWDIFDEEPSLILLSRNSSSRTLRR